MLGPGQYSIMVLTTCSELKRCRFKFQIHHLLEAQTHVNHHSDLVLLSEKKNGNNNTMYLMKLKQTFKV